MVPGSAPSIPLYGHGGADRATTVPDSTFPPTDSALARLLSLRNLAALSLVHCVLFTGLMLFAFVLGHPQPVTFVFGFTHGVLYIVMSVAVAVGGEAANGVADDRHRGHRARCRGPVLRGVRPRSRGAPTWPRVADAVVRA